MQILRTTILTMAGLVIAGQVFAHGVEPTTGTLTPAVKPIPWWQFLMPNAEAAAQLSIDEAGGYRFIKTDSLPDHQTGQFPGRGNPHSITTHNRSYRVKLEPTTFKSQTPVGHNLFGVALNGVVFDAATAEYWNNNRNWNIEAVVGGVNLGLDNSNAHVQPDGTYHYHGVPRGLLTKSPYEEKPILLGYAADGFPIYGPYGYSNPNNAGSKLIELKPSWRKKSGTRPSSGPAGAYTGKYTADWEYAAGTGDLDTCNGRQGVTPEYPDGTYHYVVTHAFPNIGRCWVGFPDNSFKKQRGGGGQSGGQQSRQRPSGGQQGGQRGGQQQGGQRGGPPQEALDACRDAREGDSCSFKGRGRMVESQCMIIPTGDMACAPPHMVGGGGKRGGPPKRQ